MPSLPRIPNPWFGNAEEQKEAWREVKLFALAGWILCSIINVATYCYCFPEGTRNVLAVAALILVGPFPILVSIILLVAGGFLYVLWWLSTLNF